MILLIGAALVLVGIVGAVWTDGAPLWVLLIAVGLVTMLMKAFA